MSTALLLATVAFVVTVALGLVLFAAVRGADIARALQDRRYRRLELRSDMRAAELRTDWHLIESRLREARQEQKDRGANKRNQLHAWQREFYAAGQAAEIQRLGVAGVKWNDQGYGVAYINNTQPGSSPGEQTVGVFFGGPTHPQR